MASTGSHQRGRSGDRGLSSEDRHGSGRRADGRDSRGRDGSEDIAAVHWPNDSPSHSGSGRSGSDSTPSHSSPEPASSDHAPSSGSGSGSSGSGRSGREPDPPPEAAPPPEALPVPEPVQPLDSSGKGKSSGSTPTTTVPHD